MSEEPPVKRAVAFFDGQNLYRHAKDAFGHHHPNYDPIKLFDAICSALGCTNAIESLTAVLRQVCRNVKRWRDVRMGLRWTRAAMLEAEKTFRRLKAYKQLPALRAALLHHQQAVLGNQALVRHGLAA